MILGEIVIKRETFSNCAHIQVVVGDMMAVVYQNSRKTTTGTLEAMKHEDIVCASLVDCGGDCTGMIQQM